MITIKTKEEIEVMAKGGKILKEMLDALGREIKIGTKGSDIEKLAEELTKKSGGKSNFKGQDGFPSCLCFSVNDEIVHGIPTGKILKDGDIVTIDTGIFFPLEKFVKGPIDPDKYPNIKKGFHTDMAITYPVGNVDPEVLRLLRATKKALKRGISKVRPGITFGDLGETIQRYSEKQGFAVVKGLCGHGIGKDLHEDPDVLNYGRRHKGPEIKEGMVFCIEPMLTMGSDDIEKGKGTITYYTIDKSMSAHFEAMVAVTKDGAKILTE
jgi:methionyl aminopeptidase